MLTVALFLACKEPPAQPPDDSAPPPVALSELPCERAGAGPAGEGDALIQWSAAHAEVRLFSFVEDFPTADAALSGAISGESLDLAAYAEALDLCQLPATDLELGEASLRESGGVWWLRPGLGAVEIPDDGAPIAIDLRGLPASAATDEAIRVAVSAALSSPLTLPARRLRRWNGLVDQVYSSTNVYRVRLERVEGETLPAARSGGALYMVTDATPSPQAAEWAGAVALGGAGHIVGRTVLAEVAESRWSAIGDEGLLWREEVLYREGGAWPDLVPASLETDHPEEALAAAPALELPAFGEGTRPSLGARTPFGEAPDGAETEANLRASLLIAHGALRRFYTYFDVVGDTIDARLLALWAEPIADPADRLAHTRRLGRLAETLRDGHAFFGTRKARDWIAGYLGVSFDHVDGAPVVVHSVNPLLLPGDAVVSIDGRPIAEVYAELATWNAAATPGYTLDFASRQINLLTGDTTLVLRDPEGVERGVLVSPLSAVGGLRYGLAQRECGTLDDLGHPEIGYINLNLEVTTGTSAIAAVLEAPIAGLIVDMRDYPGVDHYTVASMLLSGAFHSPIFQDPTWTGADRFELVESQYTLSGEGQFDGPIALIVSPVTVSAAENFSQMLVASGQIDAIVGRNSAGTNGNITGMTLPGDYYLTFTGMRLLNPDGSRFHGVGIVPTHEVQPTAADIRDNTEPEVHAAIDVLSALAGTP